MNTTATNTILNVSGYHFFELRDLPSLKEKLLLKGLELSLRGTILLAPEGFNVFLSAPTRDIHSFLTFLCETTNRTYEHFDFKFSSSTINPFNRFLVRIKKEIIAFDKVYNFSHQAPYIYPQELEALLKSDEEVILIDTRNDYETALGKFKSAIDPKIKSFKDFKDFIPHLAHLKNKKIVTYCTGGIRCEKAAVFLKEEGFNNVFQLKGGILRYFEDTSSEHYEGECFVFDKRVTITKSLAPSDKKLCYACRAPLTQDDINHLTYKICESCPHCYKGAVNAD